MWCFDCTLEIEQIAIFTGIRSVDYLIDKLIQARHNNVYKTCGYKYDKWKPLNDTTPEHSNEGTLWDSVCVVSRFIVKLENK